MTQQPTVKQRPIVFIHGAWHGAWVWEKWEQYFKAAGYEHVLPVELRGHGYKTGEYKRARLDDYVADIRLIIDTLPVPPILVGHSLGCSIIQQLLAERSYPAAVLVAPIPASKFFRRIFAQQLYRHPIVSARSFLSGTMYPWVTSRISPRLFFSAELPYETAQNYLLRMQDESFRLFMLDLMTKTPLAAPGTRTLVLAGRNDGFFTPAVLRRTADSIGADYIEIDHSGHDVMLDINSEIAARSVMQWLES